MSLAGSKRESATITAEKSLKLTVLSSIGSEASTSIEKHWRKIAFIESPLEFVVHT